MRRYIAVAHHYNDVALAGANHNADAISYLLTVYCYHDVAAKNNREPLVLNESTVTARM